MRRCIGPFIASFGISDIRPLRAGDGFRVVWFHRQFGIPVGVLIGTMLVERLLDLTAILILGGVALILIGVSAPPMLVSGFQFVLAATFFAGIVIVFAPVLLAYRSEEHTSELQSLMRISYAVFCLKKKTIISQLRIISYY